MKDLMDGYFPSELQSRYPDGIPFEVHNTDSVALAKRDGEVTTPENTMTYHNALCWHNHCFQFL